MTLKLETAQEIARIINTLLKDADLVYFSVRSDRWPYCKKGKFDNARVVDYGNGTASVALSACRRCMTGAEQWSINPYDRLLSCKTTNGYGEPILFSWRDVRDPNGTWEMWRDAADAMPYH